ncbi:hypothetical protein ACQ1Q1_04360 [Ornithobacterium rhinotracheale]|uniref:DUF4157 domain-containing protein n=1 Tax=Ornithobacterium rhinotracheale (strain ATCC 51463 / DSM 15997 / CCUG 23171 / CIP 104009 / LMG 9086) TaxID=867902 RepID=I3ZZ46_ORNRL|nr:hypothetical protein [Ornithobacterium rhinotracheale]AFL96980.1 hypothetical protein Ornrh_0783 [Ornithobacterium rhinotracheale DSM 15997]AIP99125.1 membrane protein [Ornithobacterium rhinotracheale ORT-UMN 88]KGB67012.1 membrane protein [Ornithobacterium rhinotracheale H06-030791]MBN3662973.1 hypothetical protein [Ornithobacterium rhinotracheale]MCK0194503.1 hypothetical protein [Ornithobacterium rhinotracheale]
MLIINTKWLAKNVTAMTIFPFILLKDKALRSDAHLINHERIHLKQQAELLIVPFYIWYFLEYLYHYIRLKDSYQAYRSICFEREAYAHESDSLYLKNRKFWGFWNYLK